MEARFDFSTFREVLKTRNYRSQIISKNKKGDLMNEGFMREFIEVKNLEGSGPEVLYKKDIMEMYESQCCWRATKIFGSVVMTQVAVVYMKLLVENCKWFEKVEGCSTAGRVFEKSESPMDCQRR